MLFPPAAVKQKAKEGLARLGGGIVLPFSKTQPVRFWLLCVVGMSSKGLPWSRKNGLLFLLAFKREGIHFCFVVNSTIVILLTFPLKAAGPISFPIAEKKQAEALRRDHEGLKKTINKFE